MDSRLDKFKGCLVGLAVGDALGMPSENKTHERIVEEFGVLDDYRKGCGGVAKAGSYTDDTEMMIKIAESLVHSNGLDMDDLAKRFAEWYKELSKNDRFKSSGPTCFKATSNLYYNVTGWEKSGYPSAGSGGAMRVAPIGLFYHDDLDQLRESAIKSTIITHTDSMASAGSAAIAYSVAYMINNKKIDKKKYLEDVSEFVEPINKPMADKILSINDLLDEDSARVYEKLGTGNFVMESVPSAIYSFLLSPNDYKNTVINAINAGGDTDTIAAMAGAISGAYNGINGIPKRWIEGLENLRLRDHASILLGGESPKRGRDYILKLSEGLYNLKK